MFRHHGSATAGGKLIRNSPLSGGCEPDVDVEAKGFQPTDQRLCGAVAIDGIEGAGAEILVEGAVAKHLVAGRESRGSDRDHSLFGSHASVVPLNDAAD